jgi:hypothetical protein
MEEAATRARAAGDRLDEANRALQNAEMLQQIPRETTFWGKRKYDPASDVSMHRAASMRARDEFQNASQESYAAEVAYRRGVASAWGQAIDETWDAALRAAEARAAELSETVGVLRTELDQATLNEQQALDALNEARAATALQGELDQTWQKAESLALSLGASEEAQESLNRARARGDSLPGGRYEATKELEAMLSDVILAQSDQRVDQARKNAADAELRARSAKQGADKASEAVAAASQIMEQIREILASPLLLVPFDFPALEDLIRS